MAFYYKVVANQVIRRNVESIDAPPYIAEGWTTYIPQLPEPEDEPNVPELEPETPKDISETLTGNPDEDNLFLTEALDQAVISWHDLSRIAEEVGFTKESGQSWRDSIPGLSLAIAEYMESHDDPN